MTVDHLRHLHQTTDSRGANIFSFARVCNWYNGMGGPSCIPSRYEYCNLIAISGVGSCLGVWAAFEGWWCMM